MDLKQIMEELDRAIKENEVPLCIVCGKPLTDAASGPDGFVMACSGMKSNGTMENGRSPADEHYEKSRMVFSNPEAIKTRALWERLRRTQKRLEAFQQQWMKELEDLQQRNAKHPFRDDYNNMLEANIGILMRLLGVAEAENHDEAGSSTV